MKRRICNTIQLLLKSVNKTRMMAYADDQNILTKGSIIIKQTVILFNINQIERNVCFNAISSLLRKMSMQNIIICWIKIVQMKQLKVGELNQSQTIATLI